ncbi:MAG: HAMP domain-containing protein [Chloroflexi bacterium]|nr:HAMP domain-containing protein [Chloroflexota bacterium]
MSRSLNLKLVRAFVLVIVFSTLFASVITYWMTVREFSQFVFDQARSRFITDVSFYYQTNASWEGILESLQLRASAPQPPPQNLPLPPPPQIPPQNPPGNQQVLQPAFVFILANQDGIVVVPAGDYRLGDQVPASKLAEGTIVELDDQKVGTVLATGSPPELDPREENYLTRSNFVLLYSGLAAIVAAIIIGILLARSLTRPLSELTAAIRKVSKGDLKQQVPVRSQDELGDLAAAFNKMSADLDKANNLRRQMTADIAHDLGTPLTVLSGYIEAIQAGTLEPSQERLATLESEIQQLVRLVMICARFRSPMLGNCP